jgi:glycosyltransferase involved in cell wall biosynthesis
MDTKKMPAHPLRICFVTSIHPDFDARVWKYAVMAIGRGHIVHLVCPWQVPDGEVRDGVTLHSFDRARSRATRPLANLFSLARKLRPLLSQVDVVHFHDIDILPWMAGLALFKPVVYDCHENYPDEMMVREWVPRPCRRALSYTVRVVQGMLSRAVRNVVFVVPEQQEDFPCAALHTTIIRNYASTELLHRVVTDYSSRPDAVVFIGSNYEANGTFLFLTIAERMLTRRSGVRFIMADRWADSTTRARALEFIRTRRLENVSIVPNVSPQKIVEHLNSATIGISADLRVAQRIKALPTKLFEYMVAGLPVVASDLPNSISLARQTGAILLCQPEDPNTFVSAIETLVDDRARARAMGQRGQQVFRETLSWESQGDALDNFYHQIMRPSADSVSHAPMFDDRKILPAERHVAATQLSSRQTGSQN